MQLLYEMDMTGEHPSAARTVEDEDVDDSHVQLQMAHEPEYAAEQLTSPDDGAFVQRVIEAFSNHHADVDETISANSHKWKLDRISKVDLAILRLALLEMMYVHTPSKIAINEAIELAKKYSGEKSYRFVNGVLAGYTRSKES